MAQTLRYTSRSSKCCAVCVEDISNAMTMNLWSSLQNMVEKILRMKIYDSTYWKEHCFALTAEAVVDKAVDIKSLGGTYGGARKPSKFVCLLLKLLQLQPDKDIIIEFIKNEDYKYVRILGMQQVSLHMGSDFTSTAGSRTSFQTCSAACLYQHILASLVRCCRCILHAACWQTHRGI